MVRHKLNAVIVLGTLVFAGCVEGDRLPVHSDPGGTWQSILRADVPVSALYTADLATATIQVNDIPFLTPEAGVPSEMAIEYQTSDGAVSIPTLLGPVDSYDPSSRIATRELPGLRSTVAEGCELRMPVVYIFQFTEDFNSYLLDHWISVQYVEKVRGSGACQSFLVSHADSGDTFWDFLNRFGLLRAPYEELQKIEYRLTYDGIRIETAEPPPR